MFNVTLRILLAVLLLAVVLTYRWWLPHLGVPSQMPSLQDLRIWIEGYGVWGPVVIIAAMATAILVAPLPSAPIALAAGAIYGHTWGTLYVLVGAEIGAISAFAIARYLGRDVLMKWFGSQLNRGLTGSQNFLTLSVFASRMMPFISFDIVSYAAGLTVIKFWRFAFATFAGVIPVSFLLAHFGSEMVTAEVDRILLAIVAIGLFTTLPIIYRAYKDRS